MSQALAPLESSHEPVSFDPVAADLARLKGRFDPLIFATAVLEPADEQELRLLARIHDLDDSIPARLLWGALRDRLDALVAPPA